MLLHIPTLIVNYTFQVFHIKYLTLNKHICKKQSVVVETILSF